MSFSLSSGGEASVVVGRSFLGPPPFALFAICSSLQRLWPKKCELIGACTRRLLSISNHIGMYSTDQRSLCRLRYIGRLLGQLLDVERLEAGEGLEGVRQLCRKWTYNGSVDQ